MRLIADSFRMQSRQESMAEPNGKCPACRRGRTGVYGSKSGHLLWHCSDCGTIFTVVGENDRDLPDIYDHYYDRASFEISATTRVSLEQLVRSMAKYRETGRWLDMGFGEGAILRMAKEHGWECFGTDISPAALAYGSDSGWVVTSDAENDPRFPEKGFDVLTMIEFFEHVPAPDKILRGAAHWLRPGGLLYITTPNAHSMNRFMLGLDWSIFRPPEHLTIWTKSGLCTALEHSGFEAYRIRTEGLNPCEILARLRGWFGPRVEVNRNETGFALNEAFSSSPERRALKKAINSILSGLGVGDTLKAWAIRRGQGGRTIS